MKKGSTGRSPSMWSDNEPTEDLLGFQYLAGAVVSIVKNYATAPIRAFSIRNGRAMELEIQVLP
jgi:hypothetical protein